MTAAEIVDGFRSITSIHGPLRICSPERRWCARGIWLVLFLLANAAFIYQAQLLIVKFVSYTSNVQTTLQFKMLPFPSVTVCNENPVRLSKLQELDPESESDIARYQSEYLNLIWQDGSNEMDLMNMCQSNPLMTLLCNGISFESCTPDNECKMGYYKPPEECYSYNEETGETSSCFNTTLSMYEYDDKTNFADGNDTTNFTAGNDTTKRQASEAIITFSQLQLNPKVRSDMNYLHWYAWSHGNLTLIDMYENALENITEFIEDCSYAHKRCDMSSDFVEIYNSAYVGYDRYSTGSAFGLRLRLNVRQSEYLYNTDTAGIRMAVHNKGEWPFPETVGHSAETGGRTSFGITVVETIRLPSPFGNCTNENDIKKSRVPYFYEGSYTSQGCTFSCLAIKIAERCGCIHHDYPKPSGDITIQFDGDSTKVNADTLEYCNMTMKACADKAEDDLLTSGDINSETCGCFPPCNEINYQATISSSSFPSDMYLQTAGCLKASDWYDCYTKSAQNRLQLEVYYEQLNYQRFEQQEAYSAVSLLSELGGTLGLWIGASLLSIAEFISFCISITAFVAKLTKGDVEMKNSKIGTSTPDVYKSDLSMIYSDTLVIGPKPV